MNRCAHRCPRSSCTPPTSARRAWRWRSAPTARRPSSAKLGMLRPVSLELPELGQPLVPRRLAPDQHHDHRLRPRHRRQPAACRLRAWPPWSMAALMRPATLIKRSPDEVERRPARDLGQDLRPDARAVAPRRRGRHRQVGRCARLSRRRQDRHGAEEDRGQRLRQRRRASPPSSAPSRSTTPRYVVLVMVDEPHAERPFLRLCHRRLGRGAGGRAASCSAWRRCSASRRSPKIRRKRRTRC